MIRVYFLRVFFSVTLCNPLCEDVSMNRMRYDTLILSIGAFPPSLKIFESLLLDTGLRICLEERRSTQIIDMDLLADGDWFGCISSLKMDD